MSSTHSPPNIFSHLNIRKSGAHGSTLCCILVTLVHDGAACALRCRRPSTRGFSCWSTPQLGSVLRFRYYQSVCLLCKVYTILQCECVKKEEPLPNVKAAIRLLRQIFSSAMEVAEYQRQICLPNVPKFSSALLSLADKHTEEELKVGFLLFCRRLKLKAL